MTNPQLTLTRFRQTHKAATSIDAYELPAEDLSAEDGMEGLIQLQRENVGQPRHWSFCEYARAHRKEAIRFASAVVVEVGIKSEADFRAAFEDIAWAGYLIETETKAGNAIAAVFPLNEPITDAATYSRLASILAAGLGVYRVTPGCGAITFLIQPRPFAKVEFKDGIAVDAVERVAAYKGTWIKIEDFEREPPAPRIIIPGGIVALQQRSSIQQAQTEPPFITGLFEWPTK
jgi:hypothetical protein